MSDQKYVINYFHNSWEFDSKFQTKIKQKNIYKHNFSIQNMSPSLSSKSWDLFKGGARRNQGVRFIYLYDPFIYLRIGSNIAEKTMSGSEPHLPLPSFLQVSE